MDLELAAILGRIQRSGVEVTLKSRWDQGWQLQLETEDGQVTRGIVSSLDDAAAWLHEHMLRDCPESLYSQTARNDVRVAQSAVRQFGIFVKFGPAARDRLFRCWRIQHGQ